MKVLFSHSYFLRFDPKQWRARQPYAPLGTLYAAAYLRHHGYEVAFFDTMFVNSPREVSEPLQKLRPQVFVIYDDGFNYLTKMCLTNMREAAFDMIALAKAQGCQVLVSSSDSTDRYENYLQAGADFVLLGEAEQTLLELVNALAAGLTDFQGIPGLAFLRGGTAVKTARRPVLTQLDALPMAAWDLADMEQYRQVWIKSHGYFAMNAGTTRGCPFKCNWCAKPIYGNRYNARSAAGVVQELKYLQKQYQFDYIWFCDDIFGLKPGWIQEFASQVKQHQLRFQFKIQSRADLLLQDDTIQALAEAGCEDIWIGAESGSQKILDAMDKGITVEQVYEASRLLQKNGIRRSFFIQFGYLGETRADIDKTIAMINDLLPDELGISISYPLPGTLFYEKVKADMGSKTNWKDSDELKMMFKNTFHPAFYRQLHRFVHRSYQVHQALDSARIAWSSPLKIKYPQLRKALSLLYKLPLYAYHKRRLNKLQLLEH
ncbi:MAG: B12-binding domain-containing radical SAM protein [Adhaeribacter sp.]